jgi:beta-glucanase (GH16 family)
MLNSILVRALSDAYPPKVVRKNNKTWGFSTPEPRVFSAQGGVTLTWWPALSLDVARIYWLSSRDYGKNGVRPILLALLFILGCPINGWQGQANALVSLNSAPNPKWVLTWNDEFTGPNRSFPDPTKWVVESGGNGWGNGELEYYTPRLENVHLEQGSLVIEAAKEEFKGSDGVKRGYTSGRLKTQGKFSQAYGRFEARIRIPSGQGTWPAFWLLGDDFSKVGWPACGEIDIMENVDVEKSKIRGSIHGPGYSARNSVTSGYTLPHGRFSDGFHVFAVEWEPQVIRFYVDDELYATRTPGDLPKGARWVYDHPFFLILNLAVGGNLPASPETSTDFPQRMLVDYVRVYSRR